MSVLEDSIRALIAKVLLERTPGSGGGPMNQVVNKQTGDYTLVPGDVGKLVSFEKAGTAAIMTLPGNMPEGFWCDVCQVGAQTVNWAAGSGATITPSPSNHIRTAGNGATISVKVRSNVGGSSAVWLVYGRTQT